MNSPGPAAYGFVSVMRHPVSWLSRLLLDYEVRGREHLPEHGPYIVTANHFSLVDPVFVTAAVGRLIRFMALDELYGIHKTLDGMIHYFGSISLSRDRPPFGALQKALHLLEADEVLGVFPEGARAEFWGERSIKNGAAWLSMATGAPVIPCVIKGTDATLSPAEPGIRIPSISLSFHPAIDPASYLDRVDPIGAMMNDWKSVLDDELKPWRSKAHQP